MSCYTIEISYLTQNSPSGSALSYLCLFWVCEANMKVISDTYEYIQWISAYGQLPFCNTYLKHVFYMNNVLKPKLYNCICNLYAWYTLHNNSVTYVFLIFKYLWRSLCCKSFILTIYTWMLWYVSNGHWIRTIYFYPTPKSLFYELGNFTPSMNMSMSRSKCYGNRKAYYHSENYLESG